MKNISSGFKVNHLRYVCILEYSEVYNKQMSEEKFIEMLSKMNCQKTIAILSRLASLHIACCEGDTNAKKLYKRIIEIHERYIKNNGGKKKEFCKDYGIMCPQSIFTLEKWVLLYCNTESENKNITYSDINKVIDAILVVNDMFPKDDMDNHKMEYLYLMLYYNTHKIIKDQIARAFYIFAILAKQDNQVAEFLDKYKEQRGFSVEDRLAVLFNLLCFTKTRFSSMNKFTQKMCIDIDNFDAGGLEEVYDTVVKSMRTSYKDAKEHMLKVLKKVWNFEPFYRTPFINIKGLQFAFSEATIVYQMWEGLYWDVRYTFKENGEKFMTEFGHPFEKYVQEITFEAVEESNCTVRFQNEFFYRYKGKKIASTDCYFRIGNDLFVVEAKAKSPHSDTVTGINRNAIEKEVNELISEPVIQAANRIKEIYSHDINVNKEIKEFFEGVKNVVILSVCMEKVQPLGELLYKSDKDVEQIFLGTNIIAYHNLSIEDYEAICKLVEENPKELLNILVKWFKDQRKDARSAVVLANFLESYGKKYACSKYVSNLFNESFKEITIRTFGKDLTPKLNALIKELSCQN